MNKYDVIKSLSGEVYDFIINHLDSSIEEGRYEFRDGSYANVECYQTKERQTKNYENHRKYIDIQMSLYGEEIIEICPVTQLVCVHQYDEERDVAFYSNDVRGEKNVLNEENFVIIYPGQAHIPCLSWKKAQEIKKIVFKIPIENQRKLFIMDVDGTLTDGKIYIGERGEVFKAFNIQDGYGIKNILPQINYVPIIITGRQSDIVETRCKELNITEIYQNCEDKLVVLETVAHKYGIYANEEGVYPGTAYVGDDIPDLVCMNVVQIKGCPSNAVKQIREVVDYVTHSTGGDGAVREFIEYIVERKMSDIL